MTTQLTLVGAGIALVALSALRAVRARRWLDRLVLAAGWACLLVGVALFAQAAIR